MTEGVKTAQGAQTMMEQIRAGAQKAKEMIVSLSESMSQQVTAVQQFVHGPDKHERNEPEHICGNRRADNKRKQVSKAVENVNDLTQSAASAAEEMSSATEQLSSMAQELQRLMGQFKIEEGNGAEGQTKIRAHSGNDNGNGRAEGKLAHPRALPVAVTAGTK